MKYAKIAGLGKYLPPKILTNAGLEQMVDTSDEWIRTRTGIKERRIALAGEGASSLGVKAARSALKRAGVKPGDLELIIIATITPDAVFPSTACYIQKALHAHNACCFDISAACSGFVYALVTAQSFIESGMYKNALVIGTEVVSSITDWKDRATCVLFGDGAGAAALVSSRKKSFLSSCLGADGRYDELLLVPAGGSRRPATGETVRNRLHFIKMRGNELFRHAVRMMVDAARRALRSAKVATGDVGLFIPHQANIRIINAVAKRLKLPPEKIYMNIGKYGNMSSASTAVALCEAWEKKRISKGDIVVLDTFGGGLVWGSLVIRWV